MACQMPTPRKQPLAMSALMSPPDSHKPDSFDTQLHSTKPSQYLASLNANERLPSIGLIAQPISPPVSPHTQANKEPGHIEEPYDGARDPQLFPESKNSLVDSLPLFRPVASPRSSQQVIQDHLTQRSQSHPRAYVPAQEDYELAASTFSSRATFTSNVFEKVRRDPAKWFAQEMEYLKAYPPLFPRTVPPPVNRKTATGPKPSGVKKQRAIKPSTLPKLSRTKRQAQPSPRVKDLDAFDAAHFPYTPEAKAARARSTPHKDDTDYSALPDFCPSISTLARSDKPLKTDWKGQALDLSQDPDRHMLSEAEVGVASTLRLSCAQYLCSKRRIFASRLECLRIGKEFRKTTAQQACQIDVNKASKLWTAFDKVHWFEAVHMQRFM